MLGHSPLSSAPISSLIGGRNLVLNFTDTVTVTDVVSISATIAKSDSVTVTDLVSKSTNINKSDTITVTDSVTGKNIALNKSDTVTVSDAVNKEVTLNKSDTIVVTDSVTGKSITLNKSDNVTVADTVTGKQTTINKSDTVNISDTVSKSASLNKSDTVVTSDTVSKSATIVKSDSVSVTDKPTSIIGGITASSGSGLTQLNTPTGIAIDPITNDAYIAEQVNNCISKWTPGSLTKTIVAGGNGAGSGLNQFNLCASVWRDHATGNLYGTDTNNDRVMLWTPGATQGIIVAGGNGRGSALNQLNAPRYTRLDSNGNLIISDSGNHRIVKWNVGAITGILIAGGNGVGTAANQVDTPRGTFLDEANNEIYIAESSNSTPRISKWVMGASSGVTILGGTSGGGLNQIRLPQNIHVDLTLGHIYIAEQTNFRVSRWVIGESSGMVIHGGQSASSPDLQRLSQVVGLVVLDNYLYIADATSNHRIIKTRINTVTLNATIPQTDYVSPLDQYVAIVAGGHGVGTGLDQLDTPTGIFVRPDGTLYIADRLNNVVKKYLVEGGPGIIIAGTGVPGTGLDELDTPSDIYVDANDNLYVVEIGNSRVSRWAPGSSTCTIVAGGNGYGSGLDQLSDPRNLFIVEGIIPKIYISDSENARVMLWLEGDIAGTIVAGGNGDGNATNQLSLPRGIQVDSLGNVYVAEANNGRISRWDVGAIVGTPIIDNGEGFGLDQLFGAYGIILNPDGSLYISEQSLSRVTYWKPGDVYRTLVAGLADFYNPTESLAHLNSPTGIFLYNNYIYIADAFNYRGVKWSTYHTISKSAILSKSDTVNITDQISKNTAIEFSDEVIVSDVISKHATIQESDEVTVTDEVSKEATLSKSDEVNVDDEITGKEVTIHIEDHVTVLDLLTGFDGEFTGVEAVPKKEPVVRGIYIPGNTRQVEEEREKDKRIADKAIIHRNNTLILEIIKIWCDVNKML